MPGVGDGAWGHGVWGVLGRLLVPFALVTTGLALVMVVLLHLLPDWGGVNPITGMLSDYGVRPDGWVFDTALDILSLASIAIMINLARHGVLRGRWAYGLMVAWCVCLVGIATFTKDPNLAAQTLRGGIHLYSTAAACVSLPVAAWVLGRSHRRDPRWRRFSLVSQILAWISVPCFLPFVVSFFVIRMTHTSGPSMVPTGLVERLMGVLDIGLLVLFTLWSHRASLSRPTTLSRPATPSNTATPSNPGTPSDSPALSRPTTPA